MTSPCLSLLLGASSDASCLYDQDPQQETITTDYSMFRERLNYASEFIYFLSLAYRYTQVTLAKKFS